MLLTESGLSYDEMKRVVIKIIRDKEFNQYGGIENNVALYLLDEGLLEETNSWSMSHSESHKDMSDTDSKLVSEIVWDLVIERVLTIGLNKQNAAWPFLRLTKNGRNAIKNNVVLNDIDGVVTSVRDSIPNVDDVIIMYLYECLNTYRIGATLASCVMLGCATEKAISILYDVYAEWLQKNGEDKESSNLKNGSNRVIARKFDDFVKSFKAHKEVIPREYFDDFDIVINSVFTTIRKNRNEAGHPTGNDIGRDELSAWIHVFRVHLKKIYLLIDYFVG